MIFTNMYQGYNINQQIYNTYCQDELKKDLMVSVIEW